MSVGRPALHGTDVLPVQTSRTLSAFDMTQLSEEGGFESVTWASGRQAERGRRGGDGGVQVTEEKKREGGGEIGSEMRENEKKMHAGCSCVARGRSGSLAVTNQITATTGFGLVNKHDDTRQISPIETSAGLFIQPRSAALSPYPNQASRSRGGQGQSVRVAASSAAD